ncbi:unnamed protein product [Protopolystoma xenopodis]|uniref:Uncharacterized protein n=1 Tax=Protopolystoma xenopodis TaxID=117903 RepID=A0A448X6A2_9PLAT|nr:unnamed protein product [Protopolystoma xenopodis]
MLASAWRYRSQCGRVGCRRRNSGPPALGFGTNWVLPPRAALLRRPGDGRCGLFFRPTHKLSSPMAWPGRARLVCV